MSVSEHADDRRLDPPRGRSSRLTILTQERSGASTEPSNQHGPAMSASPRCGALLAVCGLCGGAGASTIAYLIALAEARSERGDVLVADTGGPTAGSPTTPASRRHGR